MRIKYLLGLFITPLIIFALGNISFADAYTDIYNNVVYPEAKYRQAEPAPFVVKSAINETIDPSSGTMIIKQTDLSLKGNNGLNFNLSRFYDTTDSDFYDILAYRDDKNYLREKLEFKSISSQNIDFLWKFDIPYVEYKSGSDYYIHMGSEGIINSKNRTINDYTYWIYTNFYYPESSNDKYYNGEVIGTIVKHKSGLKYIFSK
jgi:hypothetical protein